jgi:hypothetical protein
MTVFNDNPALADAYADGLAAGMQLADAYREEQQACTCPRVIYLGRLTLIAVRVLIVAGIVGWTVGTLGMLGVI